MPEIVVGRGQKAVGTRPQCAAGRVLPTLAQRLDLVTASQKGFGRSFLETLGAAFYESSLMNLIVYFRSMFGLEVQIGLELAGEDRNTPSEYSSRHQ